MAKMYVISSNKPNGEFVKSAWAGEGYPRKRDAQEHIKFWEKHNMFKDEILTIETEEAPW